MSPGWSHWLEKYEWPLIVNKMCYLKHSKNVMYGWIFVYESTKNLVFWRLSRLFSRVETVSEWLVRLDINEGMSVEFLWLQR